MRPPVTGFVVFDVSPSVCRCANSSEYSITVWSSQWRIHPPMLRHKQRTHDAQCTWCLRRTKADSQYIIYAANSADARNNWGRSMYIYRHMQRLHLLAIFSCSGRLFPSGNASRRSIVTHRNAVLSTCRRVSNLNIMTTGSTFFTYFQGRSTSVVTHLQCVALRWKLAPGNHRLRDVFCYNSN